MNLEQRILELIDAVGDADKAMRTLVTGGATDLSGLNTTNRASVIGALNEVNTIAKSIIDDAAAATALDKAYSISKINDLLTGLAASIKNDLLGGAGPAYDTFKELQSLAEGEAAQIAQIMTALGLRVRVDISDQALTDLQRSNARSNIAAVGTAVIGNPDRDLAAVYTAAKV